MTPDPGPLPQFEASPIVTVEIMRGLLSMAQARDYAEAIQNHLKSLLLPVSDWAWLEVKPDQDPAPGIPESVSFLYRPGKELVAKDGEMFTTWDWRRFKVGADGFVEIRADGLFGCWYRPRDAAQQCGLTNDLLDAKYLVAQAWRVHLKETAVQPAQTETPGNDPSAETVSEGGESPK